jgi:hypothetical protein
MNKPKYELFDPQVHDPKGQAPEPVPAGWKARQAARRSLAQTFARLTKSGSELFELRREARKAKRLDEVQDLTESIFHIKMAVTHLRHIARREFDKSLEELEGYK